jgi:hypothetical protein
MAMDNIIGTFVKKGKHMKQQFKGGCISAILEDIQGIQYG